jgi:hypothetical protein
VTWYPLEINAGEVNPIVFEFSGATWFHFIVFVNSQNNCYWSIQNPLLIHEFPLHCLKVGVWCAMSKHGLLGLLLAHEIIISQWYILHILTPSLEYVSNYMVTYALLFQRNIATDHTENSSMCFLQSVFGDKIIIGDFGPTFHHKWNCVIFIVKYVKA